MRMQITLLDTLTGWWRNEFPSRLFVQFQTADYGLNPDSRNKLRERSTAFKLGDSNLDKKAKY